MPNAALVLGSSVTLSVMAGLVTLVEGDTGRVLQLNEAGSHSLLAILEGAAEDDIVAELSTQLEAPMADVQEAVRQMVSAMCQERWLERL